MSIYFLTGDGHEQRTGDYLTRVDHRLGDDRCSDGTKIRQGFERVGESQHLFRNLAADNIGWDVKQDDGLFSHLGENGCSGFGGPNGCAWLLHPNVDHELWVIRRPPTYKGN